MYHQEPTRISRRRLVGAAVGLIAGASSSVAQNTRRAAVLDRLLQFQSDPNRRILLQGGVVFSLDPAVDDFEKADILIEGKKIAAVGPNLATAARSAVVINVTDRIVMPGFIDTHHHQYETLLRSILADGLLGFSPGDGEKTYVSVIQGIFTPLYLPDDAYISELVASLNQMGVAILERRPSIQRFNRLGSIDLSLAVA